MTNRKVPLVIRGKVIHDYEKEFGGRRESSRFASADAAKYIPGLVHLSPADMSDQYRLSFKEIIDYLDAVGHCLDFSKNAYLQEAFELSRETSNLGEKILRFFYERMGNFFHRAMTSEIAQRTIGIPYLEGWVTERVLGGVEVSTRAFGARSAHIVAGNAPIVSAMSIVRNAITRGDAIVKTPSNDPMTATAIARTMIDMAPDHPLTRHLSVAYWKGGDERIESVLYQPSAIEKIIAWGGMASVRHITKYVGPGIDLITLDPKLSSSVVGGDAFKSEEAMRTAAALLAQDVGHYNQEGCVNARVVYLHLEPDSAGLENADHFGKMVWEEIQRLPEFLSGEAVSLDFSLQDELESLRAMSEDHKIIGGGTTGAVIVSHVSEPVEFSALLTNRVVNLVPIADLDVLMRRITSAMQTVGVFPEGLKATLRDKLALAGVQRITSLGYATAGVLSQPQDGIEPLRRMCKWVSEEDYTRNSADPWGRSASVSSRAL